MPPSQLTVPTSIHQLLDSVRSKIFMTTYNPTALRSGVKYIKRRLAGPRVLKYYPEVPIKPGTLNHAGAGALYPGWTGIVPGIASTSTSNLTPPSGSVPSTLPRSIDSTGLNTASNSSTEATTSSSSSSSNRISASSSSLNPDSATSSTSTSALSPSHPQSPSSDLAAALKKSGIKPRSMFFGADNWIGTAPPVAQWPTKWQVDEREEARVDKLARRRRIGKVAPKKGELSPLQSIRR